MKQNKLDEMLIDACRKPNPDIVQALLGSSAVVNVTGRNGNTPLHFACAWGRTEIVKALLARGAVANMTNEYEFTPLGVACFNDHTEIMKLLEEHMNKERR
jgi:ankyrin repeat protein